jgi:hypothetical protein
MSKNLLKPIVVVLATAATITMNILANALPLNGQNTGEISDQFDVYFVPAGYVFSIWGLIYIGLIAYAIYRALPAQRGNPALERIFWPYLAASAANIAWLFFWHYNLFPLSEVAMLTLLASLIVIYVRLGTGVAEVDPGMRWAVHAPMSLYLGWISVATIANTSDLLYYWNWSGWGISPEVWAVIMLAVAVVLGLLMALRRGDVIFLAVLLWAFAGIAVKQAGTPLVAISAWIAVALVVGGIALAVWTKRQRAVAGPAATS